MSIKPFIFTLLVLFLFTGNASASLIAPTTNSKGYNLWGTWWDMKGENGLRNGTLGGVGNNVTFLDGSGVTFLPISGTTSDLDMNGKNITNVLTINSTQANVTTINATNIQGNGSGIFQLNGSNITNPLAAVNGSALFGLNMSNQTTCRGNISCTYNANGSVSFDAVSNLTAIFNRVLNSSTVTAGVYPNGSMELTATATAATATTIGNDTNQPVVGAWRFDDNVTSDFSGNQNNGALSGGMNCSTLGKASTGCEFDSSNDVITVLDANSLDLTTDISISMWVRPGAGQSGGRTILGKGTNSYSLYMCENIICFGKAGTDELSGLVSLTTDTWSHVVVTHTNGISSIYINGTLSNSGNKADFAVTATAVSIGSTAFKGYIDEVRIYNRALTTTEISALYLNYGYVTLGYPGRERITSNVYFWLN